MSRLLTLTLSFSLSILTAPQNGTKNTGKATTAQDLPDREKQPEHANKFKP